MFTFTTEAQRSQREDFFVCPENYSGQTKSLCLEQIQEFMENRYLPILHENIPLNVLRVSNEPHLAGRMGGGTGFQVNYFLALVMTHVT